MITLVNDVLFVDGQTFTHYHSDEGRTARLAAVLFAQNNGGCWLPGPCAGSCCEALRLFMADMGVAYTGVSAPAQPAPAKDET